jgi:hypothetical protein
LAEGAAAALLQPTLKDMDSRLRGNDEAAGSGNDGNAPRPVNGQVLFERIYCPATTRTVAGRGTGSESKRSKPV